MIINYRQGWELPFHTSSGIGLEEVDLVIGDRHRTTPLMIAVQKRHDTVVKKLTSQSALQHHPNVAVALRCVYVCLECACVCVFGVFWFVLKEPQSKFLFCCCCLNCHFYIIHYI
jgi:hypothetical protein